VTNGKGAWQEIGIFILCPYLFLYKSATPSLKKKGKKRMKWKEEKT
jgi:hypothetical protein